MRIWRLIAHHEQGAQALSLMKERNLIAIGWTDIGNLVKIAPTGPKKIGREIRHHYPNLKNSGHGGSSLWNFYRIMQPGDFVIISHNGRRRCVFEVLGDYFFDDWDNILEYGHQRRAALTDIDPNTLWKQAGNAVAKGENQQWTLALCYEQEMTQLPAVYEEGQLFSVISTAIERSPAARDACLAHYDYKYECNACGFNFEKTYGEHGKHYIHVHHRVELASSNGPIYTNPAKDLVPLCPNCHAMVHRGKGTMSVEELKRIIQENKADLPTMASEA